MIKFGEIVIYFILLSVLCSHSSVINSLVINGKNSFGLLHTNICSLQLNFDNVVIALSETWNSLSKCHVFNAGNLDGYKKFTGTSGITIKSGCGFYIKIITMNTNLSGFKIIDSKKVNTLVGVYYRHPKKTSDDTFNNDLKKTLKKISKRIKIK